MRIATAAKFAAAVLLSGSAANAATILIDFNDLTAPGFTGTFEVFPLGVGGVAAAPNATPFLAVPSAQAASGTAKYSAPAAILSFSFDWGTPDSYNTVSFFSGATQVGPTLTGTGLLAGTYTYNFTAGDNITSVDFGSSNRAFEIDNLSLTTVPEPATWALLVTGFGLVGFAARRRVRSLTA